MKKLFVITLVMLGVYSAHAATAVSLSNPVSSGAPLPNNINHSQAYEFNPEHSFVLADYVWYGQVPTSWHDVQKNQFVYGYNITKGTTLVGHFTVPFQFNVMQSVLDAMPIQEKGISTTCHTPQQSDTQSSSCPISVTNAGNYHLNVILLRRSRNTFVPVKKANGDIVMQTYLLRVN